MHGFIHHHGRTGCMLWLLASGLMSPQVHACLDDAAVTRLASQELQALMQRIPPAFADTVEDGHIQSRMTQVAGDDCQAMWQLTLPAQDLEEARAVLQAQPAKQIMLAAQGYEIPQQTTLQAVFRVDAAALKPQAKEALQTTELGKLRTTVELIYALLTQARADTVNQQLAPWSGPQMAALNQDCQQQFTATASAAEACSCRSTGLSARFSARQVRYNAYLNSNPYAFASGHGAVFKQLDKQLQAECGLSPVKK